MLRLRNKVDLNAQTASRKRQQKIMEVAGCDAVTITIDGEIAK
jgi:hypothetical protein